MKTNLRMFKAGVGLFCATMTHLATANVPANAAQKVVLRYGLLSESISVEELQSIAQTGKVQGYYKKYTDKLPIEKRRELLEKLQKNYSVNFVTLSRFLYTPGGSAILQDLSKVTFHSENGGMQALRGALVKASINKEGLSIISFIQAYPSEQIEVDIEKAHQAFKSLNLAYQQTEQFMKAISPRLTANKSVQLNLPVDPTQAGDAVVHVLNLNLRDEKRFSRSVPVDIYFPKTTKPIAKPVVVLSHGFSSNKSDLMYVAKHLTSHGYVVAAVEHTGSNQNYKINWTQKGGIVSLMKPQEFLERPRDISFILDKLTEFNKQANHPLFNQISPDNVTVIGHSFGGGTALAIAGGEIQIDDLKSYCRNLKVSTNQSEWLQCIAQDLPEKKYQLRDDRVKQVIALNPTTSLMFGQTGLKQIQVPTLILASSADKTTPALTEQVISFNQIPSPKWLVGIVGATHGSVKDPISTAQREGLKDGEVVGEKAADIHEYIQAITLGFVSQYNSSGSTAQSYQALLTPEYAQYASTPSFHIRLVREIPEDVMTIVYKIVDRRNYRLNPVEDSR